MLEKIYFFAQLIVLLGSMIIFLQSVNDIEGMNKKFAFYYFVVIASGVISAIISKVLTGELRLIGFHAFMLGCGIALHYFFNRRADF